MRNLILIVIVVVASFSLLASLRVTETQTKTKATKASEHLIQQNREKIFKLEQQMVEISDDPTKAEKSLYFRNQTLLLRAENRRISTRNK